jgi:hypothetical protein
MTERLLPSWGRELAKPRIINSDGPELLAIGRHRIMPVQDAEPASRSGRQLMDADGGVEICEHLEMIGVTDLLARIDVDEDCHF